MEKKTTRDEAAKAGEKLHRDAKTRILLANLNYFDAITATLRDPKNKELVKTYLRMTD